MQVQLSQKIGIVICSIQGEINIDTVGQLKKVFGDILHENPRRVLLDFKEVAYIDSVGIAALLGFAKNLKNAEGVVSLCELSPKLTSLFGITKIDKVFKIFDTRRQALKNFPG